jgi:hypothetical protein
VDLVNYARETGESAPLLEHAAACQGCSNFADLYRRTYKAGGYFSGAGWSVRDAVPYPFGRTGFQVLAAIDVSRGAYRETADSPERILRANELEFRFVVAFSGDSWTIREMQSTES